MNSRLSLTKHAAGSGGTLRTQVQQITWRESLARWITIAVDPQTRGQRDVVFVVAVGGMGNNNACRGSGFERWINSLSPLLVYGNNKPCSYF